ncbi:hypothetical protein [Nocardioides sp. MH1]|uniref:hypothetical protein n=1 Tax=Nocardioides sp. MH1 TaxID=3242490 RepID=UPI003522AC16
MATFTLTASSPQSEGHEPVVVVEADDLQSVPTSARPVNPENHLHVDLAMMVEAASLEDPEHSTVLHFASSLGGYREQD